MDASSWSYRLHSINAATTTATFAETPLVNAAETKAEVTDVVLGTKGTYGLVKTQLVMPKATSLSQSATQERSCRCRNT